MIFLGMRSTVVPIICTVACLVLSVDNFCGLWSRERRAPSSLINCSLQVQFLALQLCATILSHFAHLGKTRCAKFAQIKTKGCERMIKITKEEA